MILFIFQLSKYFHLTIGLLLKFKNLLSSFIYVLMIDD